ncbi:hypothetical protein [Aquimarina pacifica]|uniref:hypothetical protein n=1 Tax=Aquimarina pacifica TaxID=1296415 RepID=UPI001268B4BD|nr:hypothetical protein [Aquimarina pacifica]
MKKTKDDVKGVKGKSTNSFKPHSQLTPFNEVKKQFDLFDEIIYRTDLFYLNIMCKLKKYSESIWSIIILLFVGYLIIWLLKNF